MGFSNFRLCGMWSRVYISEVTSRGLTHPSLMKTQQLCLLMGCRPSQSPPRTNVRSKEASFYTINIQFCVQFRKQTNFPISTLVRVLPSALTDIYRCLLRNFTRNVVPPKFHWSHRIIDDITHWVLPHGTNCRSGFALMIDQRALQQQPIQARKAKVSQARGCTLSYQPGFAQRVGFAQAHITCQTSLQPAKESKRKKDTGSSHGSEN